MAGQPTPLRYSPQKYGFNKTTSYFGGWLTNHFRLFSLSKMSLFGIPLVLTHSCHSAPFAKISSRMAGSRHILSGHLWTWRRETTMMKLEGFFRQQKHGCLMFGIFTLIYIYNYIYTYHHVNISVITVYIYIVSSY